MATKQQIRKYINNIRSCNRIECFIGNFADTKLRWIHFISRKGEFLGFTMSTPESPLDNFVKSEKKYMISKEKIRSDVGDSSIYTVRCCHLKQLTRDGVIVRKDGRWTLIK